MYCFRCDMDAKQPCKSDRIASGCYNLDMRPEQAKEFCRCAKPGDLIRFRATMCKILVPGVKPRLKYGTPPALV